MPILLPTRNRKSNIKRFLECYKSTGAKEPVVLLTDEDDPIDYEKIIKKSGLANISFESKKRMTIGLRMNDYFYKNRNEEYYALIADDVVPETESWDAKMKAACLPDKLVWASDGLQNENLPTHPFIGGELVRKLGWIAYPGLNHCFVDNVWRDIAYFGKRGVYMPDVKLTHYHWINKKAEKDSTYNEQPSLRLDHIVYEEFREYGINPMIEMLKNI